MGLFLIWTVRSVENETEQKGQKKNKDKRKIRIILGVNKTLSPNISCFFAMNITRKKEKLVYLMSVIDSIVRKISAFA